MDEYREANLKLWNDWTEIHEKSASYDLAAFRAGRSSLHSLELEELGDVRGKSLLHLQCHFGKDSLSWARMGASVTGVDWSEKAIKLARSLSAELGIPAAFICSDIYELSGALSGQFDIIFTSYGVLGWLANIERWGQIVGRFLKPGGTFYIVEFHPFAWIFDDSSEAQELKVLYPYFHFDEPLKFETQGSYADRNADYHAVEYAWNHSISDVINSLISAGLRVEFLHEFPFSVIKSFPFMQKGDDGWWRLEGQSKVIPLMFSLKATKDREAQP